MSRPEQYEAMGRNPHPDPRFGGDARITVGGIDVSKHCTGYRLSGSSFELKLIPSKQLGLPYELEDLEGLQNVELLTSRSARIAYLFKFRAAVGESTLEANVNDLIRMTLPFSICGPTEKLVAGAPGEKETAS